jgi:quinol monooxygenase YgiN
MYVVTVEFNVKNIHATSFRKAVLQQAHNTLSREPDCHRFDVCFDPKNDTRVFLYEIYTDEHAFQEHLQTDHFSNFNEGVKDWLDRKSVQTWFRPE